MPSNEREVPYTPRQWAQGDLIEAEKLKALENAVGAIDNDIVGNGTKITSKINQVVQVSENQPVDELNKVWVRSEIDSISVPTEEEFEIVKAKAKDANETIFYEKAPVSQTFIWHQGTIDETTGVKESFPGVSNAINTTISLPMDSKITKIHIENGYKMKIFKYAVADQAYIECDSQFVTGYRNTEDLWNVKFAILVMKSDESAILVSNPPTISYINGYGYTDDSLTTQGRAADAKAVGDSLNTVDGRLMILEQTDIPTLQSIATVQEDTIAIRAYAVGEYFTLNNKLYKVTTAIAQNGTIIPQAQGISNYNCTEIINGLSNEIQEVASVANAATAAVTNISSLIATVETSTTASHAIAVDSYFILDDVLYKATADIAIGDPIVTTGTGANAAQVRGGVTGEVADLKSALNIYGISPLYFWNIGKNMSSSGALQNNTSMALTSIFNANGGDIIKNTTPAKDVSNNNLLFYVNQFSGGVWQSRKQLSSGDSITLASTTDGVRIGYGRPGSAGIIMTQEDVDAYFSMKVFSTARYVEQFDTLSGTTFSANTMIGLWNISPDTFNSMADRPDYVFGGGTFIVVPAGGFNLSRLQIIYDVVNKNAFTRYLSFSTTTNKYTANDWKYINLSAIDNAVTIRSLATGTSLAENTDIGIYRVGSYAQSPQSDYVDMPVANFSGGTLEVIPAGGSNGIKQILTDVTNGNKYARYISGSSLQTVGPWNADKGIKWAAIGDSITYGVYSTGSDTTAVNQNKCYIKRIANALGCETFTNLGVRGLGFVHAGNNSETLKDNVIDVTTWTDYNLVTVALGINDYYGVSNIGSESSTAWDNTVYGNIRGTIESIITANPAVKLVFITPFNMSKYGDASTHWGKEYSRNHIGTLNAVKTAIIYWCEYYGIEYINEMDYSVINDLNIQTMLLDGLHPSWAAHELIAHELAKKIPFA